MLVLPLPSPWCSDTRDIVRHAVAPDTLSWLREAGSITARLRARWPALAVEVLDEGLRSPAADEGECLGLAADAACWVREVRLQVPGQVLVRARTVIPDWGGHNPWQAVATLGRRPLGELLFSLPGLQRSPLEFAWVGLRPQAGTERALATPARRRVHRRGGAPLLLTEAFDFLAAPVTGAIRPAVAPPAPHSV